MDEVWVPSEWQRDTFIASGVDAAKIRVVPEGVNTTVGAELCDLLRDCVIEEGLNAPCARAAV